MKEAFLTQEGNMIVLKTHGLSLAYADRPIFSALALEVHHGQRVGLVGPNGGGKSSLLQVLAGTTSATNGVVHWQPDPPSLGYLPQTTGDAVDQESARGAASGGERVRQALVQLFRQAPLILLLDEPTNHLDFEGLEWLEERLRRFSGTALIASHDRYFLEQVTTQIIEIDHGRVRQYAGGYPVYVEEKRRQQDRQRDAYDAYEAKRRQLEAIILKKRQAAFSGSTSKIKTGGDAPIAAKGFYAGKGKASGRVAAAMQQRLERLKAPPLVAMDSIKWHLAGSGRGPRQVIRATGVGFAYEPGRWIFRDATFVINRGDRVGLVGLNGSGKSTLLHLVQGALPPSEGKVDLSPVFSLAVIDQHPKSYGEQETVVDVLRAHAPGQDAEVRNVLAALLLRGDRIWQRACQLSGGEQVRLELAKMRLKPPDVLLLDEPTNHLDLASRQVVEEALAGYQGTLIVASHDRHLLNRLANRLLVVSDARISPVFDSYDHWRKQVVRANQGEGPNDEAERLLLLEVRLAHVSSELANPRLKESAKQALDQEFFSLRQALKTLRS